MPNYQETESKSVREIKKAIPSSLKRNMLDKSKGMFAELYETDAAPGHYVACAIDSVGTKIIIAEALGIYDTIGIDCVAMSANDLATLGAVSPFLFMDCLSCQSEFQDRGLAGDIIKGISKGLEQCDAADILKNPIKVNFGKGETASVDELIFGPKEGMAFDLVGCMIGFIQKEKVNTQKISEGDKIIALPSSGPHSNGFTALRHYLLKGDFETRGAFKKRYKGKYSLEHKFDGSTLGKVLLEPTRIYIKAIAKIAKQFNIAGVNNTGYGLKNFNRNKGFKFVIDNPLKPQPVFELMQSESGFSDEQMYSTFNMGMGFFIISKKEDLDDILQISKDGSVVGEVRKGNGTILLKEGKGKERKKLIFENY